MLAVCTNAQIDAHNTGPRHPERAARLTAAAEGLTAAGVDEAILRVEPRPAELSEVGLVHDGDHLERIAQFCAAGGGQLDPDTPVVAGSWPTALLAAGGGLATLDVLRSGAATAGLVLCRPPGHHATRNRAMGFCLVNSIAVTAATLVDAGERVAIIDWDVHHGNGTQEIFWNDPRVLFVSMHQAPPHYPGTGSITETGGPLAPGATINFPLPPGATGDVLLAAMDELIAPAVAAHATTWVLVSAGFDGHRDDPLADLALTAGDFADMTNRVKSLVANGRLLLFLEGGYDMGAVRNSVGAVAAALLDVRHRPEPASSGGQGRDVVARAQRLHLDAKGAR